ncbi:terpenoid synthase [Trametes sanguinea]|nr:terpenoid synthase [Trametes sanguinea]
MSVQQLRRFPTHFRLKDLTAISAPFMELKTNPYQESAAHAANAWFERKAVYDGAKMRRFFSHRFDAFAGMAFPDADTTHLTTCLKFIYWAFSFDDLSDEGLRSQPDAVQAGVDISMQVLKHPDACQPEFPYACMLQDIWKQVRSTASTGSCNRFARAVESWMRSLVEQARNRSTNEIPSVQEFIHLRRRTIGGRIAEAMVEYSLDLQIPKHVWEHPVLQEMSTAIVDIMTWPNDLCSFNKEQADGDYQNLVFCIMLERDTDLQSAVDILTDMLVQRVADYVRYKSQLPSFGPEVDSELARYNKALEHFTQATIVWYYKSPRYFRGQEVLGKPEIVVPIYEMSLTENTPTPSEQPSAKQDVLESFGFPASFLTHAALAVLIAMCMVYIVAFLKSTAMFAAFRNHRIPLV